MVSILMEAGETVSAIGLTSIAGVPVRDIGEARDEGRADDVSYIQRHEKGDQNYII